MVQMAVSVDENVKHDIEKLCNSLGINISTVVKIFFNNALLNKAFRFNIKQRINTYRSKNALKTTAAITKPKNGTQTDQVKALDLTARNARFIEKMPNDILFEICDIISGFTEIEETEN